MWKYYNQASVVQKLDIALSSIIHSYLLALRIIPLSRMGTESMAHEGERNNCFRKYRDKTTLDS